MQVLGSHVRSLLHPELVCCHGLLKEGQVIVAVMVHLDGDDLGPHVVISNGYPPTAAQLIPFKLDHHADCEVLAPPLACQHAPLDCFVAPMTYVN